MLGETADAAQGRVQQAERLLATGPETGGAPLWTRVCQALLSALSALEVASAAADSGGETPTVLARFWSAVGAFFSPVSHAACL
jgi:hypothetical protein